METPRWQVQIRVDGIDRVQLRAELDGAPTMGSPVCLTSVEAALARLERWLGCFPVGIFEITVLGAESPAEVRVTPSRSMALYFAAASVERAVAALPAPAGRKKRMTLGPLFGARAVIARRSVA